MDFSKGTAGKRKFSCLGHYTKGAAENKKPCRRKNNQSESTLSTKQQDKVSTVNIPSAVYSQDDIARAKRSRLHRKRELKQKRFQIDNTSDISDDDKIVIDPTALDDFDSGLIHSSDDEETNQMSTELTSLHFGGAEGESKTKKDTFRDLIAKSKQTKAEMARNKAHQQVLLTELDAAWKSLAPELQFKPTGQAAAAVSNSLDTAFQDRRTVAERKLEDDFDLLMNSMKNTASGVATDRIKTKEELQQDRNARLKALETARKRKLAAALQAELEADSSSSSDDDEEDGSESDRGDDSSDNQESDASTEDLPVEEDVEPTDDEEDGERNASEDDSEEGIRDPDTSDVEESHESSDGEDAGREEAEENSAARSVQIESSTQTPVAAVEETADTKVSEDIDLTDAEDVDEAFEEWWATNDEGENVPLWLDALPDTLSDFFSAATLPRSAHKLYRRIVAQFDLFSSHKTAEGAQFVRTILMSLMTLKDADRAVAIIEESRECLRELFELHPQVLNDFAAEVTVCLAHSLGKLPTKVQETWERRLERAIAKDDASDQQTCRKLLHWLQCVTEQPILSLRKGDKGHAQRMKAVRVTAAVFADNADAISCFRVLVPYDVAMRWALPGWDPLTGLNAEDLPGDELDPRQGDFKAWSVVEESLKGLTAVARLGGREAKQQELEWVDARMLRERSTGAFCPELLQLSSMILLASVFTCQDSKLHTCVQRVSEQASQALSMMSQNYPSAVRWWAKEIEKAVEQLNVDIVDEGRLTAMLQ